MFESPRNSPNPQSLEKLFHRSGPWCLKGWGPLLTHVCVLLFRLPMVPLFNNNSGGNRVSKSWLRLLLYRSHGALNCISLFDPQHNLMGKPRRAVFSHLIYQRYVGSMPHNQVSRFQKPSSLSVNIFLFLKHYQVHINLKTKTLTPLGLFSITH